MLETVTLKDIKITRKLIESKLLSCDSRINRFDELSQKIIIDALVFLYYKINPEFVINSLCYNDFVNQLLNYFSYNKVVVNFQNVINAYVMLSNYKGCFDIQNMLQSSNISVYPRAHLSIQLFLLKGNFSWDTPDNTIFKDLLLNDFKDIPDDATLNCWEGCLLALFKAKLIDLNLLKSIYFDNNLNALSYDVVYKKLLNLLKSNDILDEHNMHAKLTNKCNILSFFDLRHVMLSVPFSQKQILQMLITQDFSQAPSCIKLFSLWDVWTFGKLGTVKKHDLLDNLKFCQKTKPTTLHGIYL